MNEYRTNEYKTTDLNLAVVLSLNFPIKELINNNGRGTFVFENTEELNDLVKDYWNRQLSIEPQALFDALKTIKNRLYNDVMKEARWTTIRLLLEF